MVVSWHLLIILYRIGTPGVGKSTLCSEVIKQIDLEWLEISKVAKMRDCLAGYDEALSCPIIDEDKVVERWTVLAQTISNANHEWSFCSQIIDELDPVVEEGGKIIEYHGCDFFPERWFDGVFVLRTSNTTLYDRLQER